MQQTAQGRQDRGKIGAACCVCACAMWAGLEIKQKLRLLLHAMAEMLYPSGPPAAIGMQRAYCRVAKVDLTENRTS